MRHACPARHEMNLSLRSTPVAADADARRRAVWRQPSPDTAAGARPGATMVAPGAFAGFASPLLRVTIAGAGLIPALDPPGRLEVYSVATHEPAVTELPGLLAAYHSARALSCRCDPDSGACRCRFCPPGTFGGAGGGCSPCPIGGWFQDEPARLECKRCPRGTFVPGGGGAAAADCVSPPSGSGSGGDEGALGGDRQSTPRFQRQEPRAITQYHRMCSPSRWPHACPQWHTAPAPFPRR